MTMRCTECGTNLLEKDVIHQDGGLEVLHCSECGAASTLTVSCHVAPLPEEEVDAFVLWTSETPSTEERIRTQRSLRHWRTLSTQDIRARRIGIEFYLGRFAFGVAMDMQTAARSAGVTIELRTPMATDYTRRAHDLAQQFRSNGNAQLAEHIMEAVASGSTGSEILMRLRWLLSQARLPATLAPELREQARDLEQAITTALDDPTSNSWPSRGAASVRLRSLTSDEVRRALWPLPLNDEVRDALSSALDGTQQVETMMVGEGAPAEPFAINLAIRLKTMDGPDERAPGLRELVRALSCLGPGSEVADYMVSTRRYSIRVVVDRETRVLIGAYVLAHTSPGR